jgi:hypothetical protein
MRRLAAYLILGIVALLLAPGAPSMPTVPGDPTPPVVTPMITGTLGNAGWYTSITTVNWSIRDPESIILSTSGCDTRTMSADTMSTRLACTAVSDGGETTVAKTFQVDMTAPTVSATPQRPADRNGWYNRAVSVNFTGGDAASGVESCDPAASYSGPDGSPVSIGGGCRDRAGNLGTGSVAIRYDATGPAVSGVPVRAPDRGGWYNRPVAFAMQGTDALSGLDFCPPTSYSGPDGANASFTGACFDKAGNLGTKAIALRYDGTGPQVAASPSRGPDSNGWYNQPLSVSFSGGDAVSGLESCVPPQGYSGPDSAAAVVEGACLDAAGNVGVGSLEVHYDATPPQVTGASANRLPDWSGWYNHPLLVSFYGTDLTSKVEICTEARFAGPDSAAVSLRGACVDYAGNASAAGSFALRYDGTPPSLTGVTVKPGNGKAVISWRTSSDTVRVEVRRAGRIVYRGRGRTFEDMRLENGRAYRYTVAAYDQAGNAKTARVVAKPSGPLLSPAAGAKVSAPPRLVWKAVGDVSRYHVQLWRSGRILSAWPKGTSFQLRRTWTYQGRRYRLSPGTYRWYVWPYDGRAKRKFGPLVGSSSFVVR